MEYFLNKKQESMDEEIIKDNKQCCENPLIIELIDNIICKNCAVVQTGYDRSTVSFNDNYEFNDGLKLKCYIHGHGSYKLKKIDLWSSYDHQDTVFKKRVEYVKEQLQLINYTKGDVYTLFWRLYNEFYIKNNNFTRKNITRSIYIYFLVKSHYMLYKTHSYKLDELFEVFNINYNQFLLCQQNYIEPKERIFICKGVYKYINHFKELIKDIDTDLIFKLFDKNKKHIIELSKQKKCRNTHDSNILCAILIKCYPQYHKEIQLYFATSKILLKKILSLIINL